MQRIERDVYSISAVPAEAHAAWYERLARLISRPERKAKIDPQNGSVDGMSDHMQTLMVSDLFLRK